MTHQEMTASGIEAIFAPTHLAGEIQVLKVAP